MTTFTMEAKENYDAASVALLDTDSQSAQFFLDPGNIATGYDFVRRKIMYLGCIIPDVNVSTHQWTNATGFSLFSGYETVVAPGDNVLVPHFHGPNTCVFSPQVCEKDIDTGAVVFYETYSSSATIAANVGSVYPYISNEGSGYTTASVTVTGDGTGMTVIPILDAGGAGRLINCHVTDWGSGYTTQPTFSVVGDGTGATITADNFLGGSDGTWRWIGANYLSTLHQVNGPGLVNPRNSDYWTVSASCEIYQYRQADGFAQTIGPALLAINSNTFHAPTAPPVGIDATWCYCLTNPNNLGGSVVSSLALILIPAAYRPDEETAASKLTYVVWNTSPFCTDQGARLTFSADGHVYVMSLGQTPDVNWSWRVCRYTPPALATFGTNLPGTMDDVTPWGAGVGPNADGLNYSLPSSGANGSLRFALVRLPATNQFAAVLKFPKENSADSSDYNNTVFSCAYLTCGATPTYEYHSGFVTGYMNASWVSVGSIPATGWAVVDCRETNNFQEQSDYQYTGVDYTKRWFVFQCYPIVASAVDTSNGLMDVLVEYRFVSGSPPAVVAPPGPLTDPDWSANYPAYQTAIGQQNLVLNSMAEGTVATGDFDFTVWLYPDPGIFDATSNAFWFSGIGWWNTLPSDLPYNAMFYLDAAFTPRAAYNDSGQPNNTIGGPITPPFLRLSFTEPTLTFANSFVRSFVGNPQL